MEGGREVRGQLDRANRAGARGGEDRGHEGRRPCPHPKELPGMERVAQDQPHRGAVPQHGPTEAHSGARWVNDVRRRAQREPQHDDAHDRTARAHEKGRLVSAPRERRRRQQQRQRVPGRGAGDQPADRGAAPLGGVAIGDQHDRRRVGSALRERHEPVQHETGRVGPRPEPEGDRRDRAEPG